MRGLAQASNVAPKTLYHQFGSKENLLRTAVEERYRYYYRMIDEHIVEHGVDRLLYIVDTVSATSRENLAYADAMLPMLRDASNASFNAIRNNTYRRGVDQIAQEGDFLRWVDVDLVASIIFRQISPLHRSSWIHRPDWEVVPKEAKLEMCLMLIPLTRGYTHDRASKIARKLHDELGTAQR